MRRREGGATKAENRRARMTTGRMNSVSQWRPNFGDASHRVEVRSEAVERDVPEIEEPRETDDDAQAEREQHVEQRVEADANDVAVARDERQQRSDECEREVERRPWRAHEFVAEAPGEPLAALTAVVVARDPRIDPDLRDQRPALVRTVGDRRDVVAARHQTFCSVGWPSSPLGRTSITAMRSANTIACWNVDER